MTLLSKNTEIIEKNMVWTKLGGSPVIFRINDNDMYEHTMFAADGHAIPALTAQIHISSFLGAYVSPPVKKAAANYYEWMVNTGIIPTYSFSKHTNDKGVPMTAYNYQSYKVFQCLAHLDTAAYKELLLTIGPIKNVRS